MVFNQDCDLIDAKGDCMLCYRYDLCEKYFAEHPDKVYCPDDQKAEVMDTLKDTYKTNANNIYK